MAPVKRSASAAPTGRAGKMPKVDPAIERVRCVFDLIQDFAPNLPEPVSDMLRGMMPHALRLPAAERHAYQAEMVKTVQTIADEAKEVAVKKIQDAEADIASHAAEMNASEEVLGKARSDEETKLASKKSAADALTIAQDAESAANTEVERAQALEAEEERAAQAAVDARVAFEETFTTTWRSLADGTFDGKDWRKRNKAIASMVKLLEETKAAESLQLSVGTVLKEKPEARGGFALKAMEHGEAHMQARLDALVAGIQEAQGRVADAKIVVSEATTKAETAAKDSSVAYDASVAANKEWTEADRAVKDMNRKIKGFGKRTRELDDALKSQKASSERLHELISGFELLRDAVADSIAPTDEVAAKVPPQEAVLSAESAAVSGA